MRFQVLCIDDCPNSAEAVDAMRRALDRAGFSEAPVDTVVLGSDEEAARVAFGGSPTFLIDGADPFPAQRTRTLACRVYVTADGLRGVPEEAELVSAILERT